MAYLHSVAVAPSAPAPESIVLVHSSFLQAATYDAENYSLTLDFKSGHQVVHRFVYPIVWQQFKEHPSPGSFYAKSIKGKYPSVSFRTPLLVSQFTRAKKESTHGPTKR